MSAPVFLDTNVFVYAEDADQSVKARTARALIERCVREGNGVVSTQVLGEFVAVATRKLGVAPAVVEQQVHRIARGFEVVPVSVDRIAGALELLRAHSISWWDALIVRCASDAGCLELYTEDFQHDQRLGKLRIVNPFSA